MVAVDSYPPDDSRILHTDVMAKPFDLIILGSGSTAFAAALRAQELGKSVLMAEERTIGGTCANRGCLPSKNLIEAAKRIFDARHPRYPGLVPARLQFDFEQLIAQKDAIVTSYREKKYDSLVGEKILIEHGHALFADAHTIDVDGKHFTGKTILIATGSRPVLPDIRGLADVPYLTSDLLTSGEAVELKRLPRSLLVVGSGYVALELGQMFHRLGVDVTLLEQSERLLSRGGHEPEVGHTIRRIFDSEGIEVLTQAVAQSVRRDRDGIVATVTINGAIRELAAEQLLVATGRRPNSDGIAIERAAVLVGEHGHICVDETLRTNVHHIFAAGDVIGQETGSQMATPVGSQDGGIAADNALSGRPLRCVDHRVVPRVIFVDPPIAVVGMTEVEAVAAGRACWCRSLALELVPRAAAIRDTRGFVKMIADANTHEVLGVTMVGNSAAEVIHEAAMALRFRATLLDFIEQLHVYPTMAEALKIVAISRFKDPAKLSCCAQ